MTNEAIEVLDLESIIANYAISKTSEEDTIKALRKLSLKEEDDFFVIKVNNHNKLITVRNNSLYVLDNYTFQLFSRTLKKKIIKKRDGFLIEDFNESGESISINTHTNNNKITLSFKRKDENYYSFIKHNVLYITDQFFAVNGIKKIDLINKECFIKNDVSSINLYYDKMKISSDGLLIPTSLSELEDFLIRSLEKKDIISREEIQNEINKLQTLEDLKHFIAFIEDKEQLLFLSNDIKENHFSENLKLLTTHLNKDCVKKLFKTINKEKSLILDDNYFLNNLNKNKLQTLADLKGSVYVHKMPQRMSYNMFQTNEPAVTYHLEVMQYKISKPDIEHIDRAYSLIEKIINNVEKSLIKYKTNQKQKFNRKY